MLTNLIWNNFISCIFTTLIMKMRTYSCVYTFTEGVVWASEATFNSDIIKIHRNSISWLPEKLCLFFIISIFFISGCLCIGFYKTLCYISIWSKPLFNLGDCYLFFNISMYIVCIWICSTFSPHFINKKSPQNIFKDYYFTRKNDKNCIKLFVMNWIIL